MRGADVYYGAKAERYDAEREIKAKWKAEQAALAEFLETGPVLDVPFGTGRFVPIYRDKGLDFVGVDISEDMLIQARRKYPGIDARKGSILDLDFEDGSFGTVVCVRFLEWVPLEQAKVVIRNLSRLAGSLIVTINHGKEGCPEAFTYALPAFLEALDGLRVVGRRVTAEIPGITSEMFNLRRPTWDDVLDVFRFDTDDPQDNLQRVSDKHAEICGLDPAEIKNGHVRCEYRPAEFITAILDDLPERFRTDEVPRFTSGPFLVLERDGKRLLLDGRRRANRLGDGPHEVLIIAGND